MCVCITNNFMIWLWCLMLAIAVERGLTQQQTFRTVPSDTEVIQGQTTFIRCGVENKKGLLQWIKDGFALGSDQERGMPGYPRYSIDGNEALGEYDLMIRDASLVDDAEYQCQVLPFDNEPNLVGVAQLNVLIPPQKPEIENYKNGSVVKVPHKQVSLQLTCISQKGKPAATIKWLRNGEEITEGIENLVEAIGDKLETAKSTLTIAPKKEDNDALYSCQARNKAMLPDKTLNTIIALSVMHPPGPPKIVGYDNDQVVKTGATLQLVCISEGGNPLAQVHWYKNNKEIDFSYKSGSNKAENELIFTVQPNDNDAVYRCEASNLVTPDPLVTEIKLVVQFAPASVTISGYEYAKAGETITLKCQSAISNPPAIITWFSRGRQLHGGVSETKPSPKGGFVTSSSISVTLTDQENDVIYQCHATNDALGQTVVDTQTLKVMYPPETPTISGYTDGKTVEAGQVQSLTCTSVGGNPLATLTWWKGENQLEGAIRITGNIVSSQVSFILKPDDNGADYRCNATNPATPEPLLAKVRLKVNFPPKSLNITTMPKEAKAGEPLTLTCTSASSNPPSTVSWWKDGENIAGRDGGVVPAAYGGQSTVSKLVLIPSPEDNMQIYACRATNILLEQAVSDAVTLDVLYKPVFPPNDSPDKIEIIEFQSFILNLTVNANPSDVTYTWSKDGEKLVSERRKRDISMPQFIQDNGILNITNITREDAGTYTCEASNSQGKMTHELSIDVQYPAVISSVNSLVVDQTANATLICEVSANPILDDMITWSRNGYDMARAIQSYASGKSTLTILNTNKDDSGVFICEANNKVGEASTKEAHLVVKFAPEIDRSPTFSKAAADKGSTGTLICKARGAPEVTFEWYRGARQLDTSGTKYSSSSGEIGLVHYQSKMMVHNSTTADYGQYKCKAINDLGDDSTFINLDGTSKPDPPYDLQFVNATHNSITIAWVAGFDGGSTQRYQVRYNQAGETAHKYEDVRPSTSTIYTVRGLLLATEYEMTVRAINVLGEGEFQLRTILTKTSAVAPISGDGTHKDDVPLIIILTVSIVGILLLGLNMLLILFFIRRRRKKLEKEIANKNSKFNNRFLHYLFNDKKPLHIEASESASQANTLEMLSAPTITEDTKSYGSYDRRSLPEDYPEDYKFYDEEEEMRRFLPPPYHNGPYPPSTGEYGPLSTIDSHRGYYGGKGSREGIYSDDQMPSGPGWDAGRQRSPLPAGSLPRLGPGYGGPRDHDEYTDQLRQMQKGITDPMMAADGRLPPPPPTRSTSKGTEGLPMPPIPSRNYGPEEVPRYAPAPGSTGYNPAARTPAQHGPPDVRGHLV